MRVPILLIVVAYALMHTLLYRTRFGSYVFALGGTSFERGEGWLPGTLIGALTIGVLRNGLNLMAAPSALQVSCIGLLVILAFTLEAFRTQKP